MLLLIELVAQREDRVGFQTRSPEPDPTPTPCTARGRGPALSSPSTPSDPNKSGSALHPWQQALPGRLFIFNASCVCFLPFCGFCLLPLHPQAAGCFFFFFALSFFHLLSFKNTHWQRLGQAYLH